IAPAPEGPRSGPAALPGLPVLSAAGPGSTPPSIPAPPLRTPGRAAASGLIRGLRGLSPFDGSQFPRLPWGGQPVSESDIQFIERWIDDGCPETDSAAAVAAWK